MNAHDIGAVTVNECLVDECDSNKFHLSFLFSLYVSLQYTKRKKKKSIRAYSPICTISALGTAGIIC